MCNKRGANHELFFRSDFYCIALDLNSNVQPVGDIEGGILGCSWSNDQEMFLVVTASGSLVLLNNSFEVLDEHALEDLDYSANPTVSISWRSDGENVSINYPLSSGERCIAVFTRELTLVSTSYKHDFYSK